MARPDPKYYFKKLEKLQVERSTLDTVWSDVAKYCLPRKDNIQTKTLEGQVVETDIFDTTAPDANNIMAAGLHGYLTNPASRWFGLNLQNKELMSDHAIKEWLHIAEEQGFAAFNNSNFHEEIHEVYLDLGTFGTAHMYSREDAEDIVRYTAIPVSEVYIEEDDTNRVRTIFRLFEYTADQCFSRWGKDCPKDVHDTLKAGDFFKKFDILHVIEPREAWNPAKLDSLNKPFRSLYFFKKTGAVLSEGGYDTLPIQVVRFLKSSGKVYGFSPAMMMLPTIKLLNKMDETMIRAAQKIVDPPLVLPHEAFILPLEMGPGALNYSIMNDGRIEPIKTGANIPVNMDLIQSKQMMIKQAFFVDMFLALVNQKNMTATEVQERVAEKMLMLGPTLGRLMSELLDPIVYRTIDILIRKGIIPAPPPILQGQRYVIEYISPLAKAQRAAEVGSINNLMMAVGQLVQSTGDISPLDIINRDEVVKAWADGYGTPPTILNDEQTVAQMRKSRQEQQQMQQAMAMQQELGVAKESDAKAEAHYAKANQA